MIFMEIHNLTRDNDCTINFLFSRWLVPNQLYILNLETNKDKEARKDKNRTKI